jgi:hypothetical protein
MPAIRTDIHRPGTLVPADYRVIAVACVFTEENLETGSDMTVFELEPTDDRWEELGSPMEGTWNGGFSGTCDHCGHSLKYFCLVEHLSTGDIIHVGRDCVSRFFKYDWSHADMVFQARKRAERNRAAFLALYPEAETALDWAKEKTGFAFDIYEKAVKKGYQISANAAAALVKAYELSLRPIEIPAGRRTLSGVVTKCTAKEDQYNRSRHKTYIYSVTIQTTEGFRTWGTLPSELCPSKWNVNSVVGNEIEFTATVKPVDAEFATFSRPSNARWTKVVPEEETSGTEAAPEEEDGE